MRRPSHFVGFPLACLVVFLASSAAQAQGPILAGAGPVSRSMGGATTAAPLDATGALYWNPATIGGLPSSQLDLGVELLYPHATLSSRIPGSSLGPGIPPAAFTAKPKTMSASSRCRAGGSSTSPKAPVGRSASASLRRPGSG